MDARSSNLGHSYSDLGRIHPVQQDRGIRLTRDDVVGVFTRSLACSNRGFEYSQFQRVFLSIGEEESRSTCGTFRSMAMGAVDVLVSHGPIV